MVKKSTEPPQAKRGTGGQNAKGPRRPYLTPETVKRGRTEQGYSHKLAKAVTEAEAKIRNNKDETLHVFDADGNIYYTEHGKGAKVHIKHPERLRDGIVTHNHPRAIGKKGFGAIGSSFSVEDVLVAVTNNAAEIRAVTPTYTFSLKRPKGGWGKLTYGDAIYIANTYKKANSEGMRYISRNKYSREATDRANSTAMHFMMKELSKHFKWDYTKKRG